MLIRRFRTWAFAVATIGAVLLGGSKQASADILLTVSAGATTESFDFTSNTSASQSIASIDGYSATIHTVVTNYPGAATGSIISTTVNITGAVTTSNPFSTTVQLITPGSVLPGGPYPTPPLSYTTQPLLAWSLPASSPVQVSSGASFATNASVTSGLATAATYYDSGPATTFATSTNVVGSTQNPANNTGNNFNQVTKTNSGTYTLSQTLVLTGINVGATGFNFGATSAVNPGPEPSSMVLAGLGALGLVGYRLRRRKALGD